MKLVKYMAILATVVAASVASAQTSTQKSEEPQITTSMSDGVIYIGIKMNVKNPMTSTEEALKKAFLKALQASGNDAIISKALNGAMGAIMAAVKDKNYPANGIVTVNVQLKQNFVEGNPVIETKTNVEIAGERLNSTTKTTVASDGSSKTEGNVNIVNDRGEVSVVPIALNVDPTGNVTGEVGAVNVATTTPVVQAAKKVTANPQTIEADVVPVPDPSVVTSKTKN